MTSVPRPICTGCIHFKEDFTCTAFPDGIPMKILNSIIDHRRPVLGDRDIQYEPIDEKEAEYASWLFSDQE